MAKGNKSSKGSSKPQQQVAAPSADVQRVLRGEALRPVGETGKAVVVGVVEGGIPGETFLQKQRREALAKAAEEQKKQSEKILSDRKSREGDQSDPSRRMLGGAAPNSPDVKLMLHNDTDETFEISVAAQTYYIGPGDTQVVSRDPRLSDRAVATFIHGQLASRGVSFREEGGVGKKGTSKKSAEAEVDEVMQNISTDGELDVPDAHFEQIKFATNPSGRNRAQPERFQSVGPLDPDGSAARERKRKMVSTAITGEIPGGDEEPKRKGSAAKDAEKDPSKRGAGLTSTIRGRQRRTV